MYYFQVLIFVRFLEDVHIYQKIKCTDTSNSNCSIHQAINKYSWLNLYFVKGHSVIELENLKQETDM